MTKSNDERILELKKQIQLKKEKLGKSSRFSPITNCLIELDGIRQNINTLNEEMLKLLLVKLNTYKISADNLEMTENLVISGYPLQDWMEDVQNKLNYITRREQEKQLKVMEDKLTELLSDGKKVELKIDEIANLLKEE